MELLRGAASLGSADSERVFVRSDRLRAAGFAVHAHAGSLLHAKIDRGDLGEGGRVDRRHRNAFGVAVRALRAGSLAVSPAAHTLLLLSAADPQLLPLGAVQLRRFGPALALCVVRRPGRGEQRSRSLRADRAVHRSIRVPPRSTESISLNLSSSTIISTRRTRCSGFIAAFSTTRSAPPTSPRSRPSTVSPR